MAWRPRRLVEVFLTTQDAKSFILALQGMEILTGSTRFEWRAWVDLNHRPRPYQGLLWCYMHSSVAMITLLTTSISRSGKPLRSPMPQFHMTRSDAEAVVTYLKSLNASQWGCRADECLRTLSLLLA